MKHFADTSFLCAFYRQQTNHEAAVEYFATLAEPLAISDLVIFEFEQGIRMEVFRHAHDPSIGYSEGEGAGMLAAFEADLSRAVLSMVDVDLSMVLRRATVLSEKHTAAFGYRAFDILHVATALVLKTQNFLTFDLDQSDLAEAEGLATPLRANAPLA